MCYISLDTAVCLDSQASARKNGLCIKPYPKIDAWKHVVIHINRIFLAAYELHVKVTKIYPDPSKPLEGIISHDQASFTDIRLHQLHDKV